MKTILIEGKVPAGAKHQPIFRFFHKKLRRLTGKRLAKGMGVDWTKGSQFRTQASGLPIKNQGSNFSCGGEAGAYFLEIMRRIQNIQEGEISAKSIYAPIAYPGGGTTITSLMTQIGAHGANLEATVPSYDSNGQPLDEIQMTDKSFMTSENIKDALSRAGYTPYDCQDDIESVAEAINTYGAVIWEITGQNGNTPDWISATPQPPQIGNPNPLWRHFMCAYDFSLDENGKQRIHAYQSMSSGWGDKGIQYFYEEYFTGKYLDAFTFIYDTKLVPNSDNHSIWAELLRWFRITQFKLAGTLGYA